MVSHCSDPVLEVFEESELVAHQVDELNKKYIFFQTA